VLEVYHRHTAGLLCSETGRTCLDNVHLEYADSVPGLPNPDNEPRLLLPASLMSLKIAAEGSALEGSLHEFKTFRAMFPSQITCMPSGHQHQLHKALTPHRCLAPDLAPTSRKGSRPPHPICSHSSSPRRHEARTVHSRQCSSPCPIPSFSTGSLPQIPVAAHPPHRDTRLTQLAADSTSPSAGA
jgi:hypothetical protein